MTRFLFIDVGNTRTKWATVTSRGAIRVLGGVMTKELTARRLSELARKYPRHVAVVASVVPLASAKIRRAFARRARFVTNKSCGLAFDYPRPAELGADRLAAAAAVTANAPAIIVACGTATVFSVIDKQGRFCGGSIAPGLGVQLAALVGSTAQLPETSLKPGVFALGRSTQAAIRSGVLLTFQAGVREILRHLQFELGLKCRVILTGGYARFLRDAQLDDVEVRPLLVLEGLHIIARRLFPAS